MTHATRTIGHPTSSKSGTPGSFQHGHDSGPAPHPPGRASSLPPGPVPDGLSDMPRSTWVFASILSLMVLGTLGYLQWRQTDLEAAAARAAADGISAELTAVQTTNSLMASRLAEAREEIADLQRRVDEATRREDDLEDRMRAELESRDVTISELQGSLTVDIVDRVLFDSGAAELKPEGREILLRVASVLSRYPGRQIQVIGHTDNVPIRGRTVAGFTDNWDLSAGRALAAVRFLHREAGVDPARLAAVGCGEFRPLADNATPEGRARNRRIAVVVLPEKVVPADLPPETPPPAPSDDAETVPVPQPVPVPVPTVPEVQESSPPDMPVPVPLPEPLPEPHPSAPPPPDSPQGTGNSSKILPTMSSGDFSSASAS